MHQTTAPKRDDNTITVVIDQTNRRTGHRTWPGKAGRHKDRRRRSRNNERVSIRKGD